MYIRIDGLGFPIDVYLRLIIISARDRNTSNYYLLKM